jgi:hypothetical protein
MRNYYFIGVLYGALVCHTKVMIQISTNNSHFANRQPGVIFPTIKNYEEFKQNLPVESLRVIYDSLYKENSMYLYRYIFGIDKNGHVVPYRYSTGGQYLLDHKKLFSPFVEYLKTRFNSYLWNPAHKNDCTGCRQFTPCELIVYFATDAKSINIEVKVQDLYSNPILYNLKLTPAE